MLADHLTAADVLLHASARNKRAVLDLLAEEASKRLPAEREKIREALQAREDLGSTAFGKGIALPHALLQEATRPFVLFARLQRPVDFDARDNEPVDLFLLVLWPPEDPKGLLTAMSDISRLLRVPDLLNELRTARSAEGVVDILRYTQPPDSGDHD